MAFSSAAAGVPWRGRGCSSVLREPVLQGISGLISRPDKLLSENHKPRGCRSGRGQWLPTHSYFFFLRWWRCSRRSVGKHQESSPAVRAQVERCTELPRSSAPATVLDVEPSIKPNKSMKTKVSDLFCAAGPANISCDPKICFSKEGRWPRGAFPEFSVSSFYYKG